MIATNMTDEKRVVIGIAEDGLYLHTNMQHHNCNCGNCRLKAEGLTVAELCKLLNTLVQFDGVQPMVMFASSVDFPEEYTDDPQLIEFCRQLRGETRKAKGQ